MYGGRDPFASPLSAKLQLGTRNRRYGAALETETTFAITQQDVGFEINLMSIQDFVAIPLGKYVQNNLEFGKRLKRPPLVFGVNYFPRGKDGKFVNGVTDKHVWVKWMELRVHGEAGCIATRRMHPAFKDLQRLFKETIEKEYTLADYRKQFHHSSQGKLDKLGRVEASTTQNDAPKPCSKSSTHSANACSRTEKIRRLHLPRVLSPHGNHRIEPPGRPAHCKRSRASQSSEARLVN